MRKYAGSFLRQKMLTLLASGLLLSGGLLGVAVGANLVRFADVQPGAILSIMIAGVIMVAAFSVGFGKWSWENLEKGFSAETRTGQAIEYALTSDGCAVAHSVISIAKVGDIDHLVVTPARVWVIETKFRQVPRWAFPKVLRRIEDNVAAVRKWAPAGTPVQGCLVLASEEKIKRKDYPGKRENVVVHTPMSLTGELKREARGARVVDERLAGVVWRLGRVVE